MMHIFLLESPNFLKRMGIRFVWVIGRDVIYFVTMSIESALSVKYPLSFTAASVRADLARIVAQTYLECGDWDITRQRILEHNLLQSRSRLSAIRMELELRHRLQILTERQLTILAHSPADSRTAIAWLAVLKHAPFVFSFVVDVLRPKFEQHDPVIRPSDYETYYENQMLRHPELASMTHSTRDKLRTVMVNMLREAGFITQKGRESHYIRPVVTPEVREAVSADDPQWLAGFLVGDNEIQSLMR